MSEWQIVTKDIPRGEEILVCVTYNIDDRNYETKTWVDEYDDDSGWGFYRKRIDIPFPPTHWMPLPEPPK